MKASLNRALSGSLAYIFFGNALKAAIPALCLLASCSTVDIAVRPVAKGCNPKTVLLGPFENRVMDFNPFTGKNFRDCLAHEFFARGYSVVPGPPPEAKMDASNALPSENDIRELCLRHSADLYIRGSIFEARYGDAVEDRTSTAVTVDLFGKNGAMIGTARCFTSETLMNAGTACAMASRLVRSIHATLSNE